MAIANELIPIGEKDSMTIELECGHVSTVEMPKCNEEKLHELIDARKITMYCKICKKEKVPIVDAITNGE